MKSFLIVLSDKQPHLLNKKLLQDHINYLKKLRKEGFLPICGPMSDNQGGILILRTDSATHADELMNNDPFIKEHYYKKFIVHEFTEAGDENNWLADSNQTNHNIRKESDITEFLDSNQKIEEKNKPLTMSILFRKLKDGKSHEDFREAWLPPVEDVSQYFGVPVLVINAHVVSDPSKIISVGLIWADVNEVVEEYKKYEVMEDIRHNKIDYVTDQIAETQFCKILDIDVLGS